MTATPAEASRTPVWMAATDKRLRQAIHGLIVTWQVAVSRASRRGSVPARASCHHRGTMRASVTSACHKLPIVGTHTVFGSTPQRWRHLTDVRVRQAAVGRDPRPLPRWRSRRDGSSVSTTCLVSVGLRTESFLWAVRNALWLWGMFGHGRGRAGAENRLQRVYPLKGVVG